MGITKRIAIIFLAFTIVFCCFLLSKQSVGAKTIKKNDLSDFCRKGNRVFYAARDISMVENDIYCYNVKSHSNKLFIKHGKKYNSYHNFYCKNNKLFVIAGAGGTGNYQGTLVIINIKKKKIIKEIEHVFNYNVIGNKLYYEINKIVDYDGEKYMEATGKWGCYNIKTNKKSNTKGIKIDGINPHYANNIQYNGAKYYVSGKHRIIRKKGNIKKTVFKCKKKTISFFSVNNNYLMVDCYLDESEQKKILLKNGLPQYNSETYLLKTNGKGKKLVDKWFDTN